MAHTVYLRRKFRIFAFGPLTLTLGGVAGNSITLFGFTFGHTHDGESEVGA